jgi:hypothetical protein
MSDGAIIAEDHLCSNTLGGLRMMIADLDKSSIAAFVNPPTHSQAIRKRHHSSAKGASITTRKAMMHIN